eukprot:1538396-Alexandrium_andersonii.AAC.1
MPKQSLKQSLERPTYTMTLGVRRHTEPLTCRPQSSRLLFRASWNPCVPKIGSRSVTCMVDSDTRPRVTSL